MDRTCGVDCVKKEIAREERKSGRKMRIERPAVNRSDLLPNSKRSEFTYIVITIYVHCVVMKISPMKEPLLKDLTRHSFRLKFTVRITRIWDALQYLTGHCRIT